MPKVEFSKRTFTQTGKYKIKSEILQAVESSREIKSEIKRIFQVANRRIQNIESKNLLSPAVQALHKEDIVGYTKFSMKHDFAELKTEYSKAISFLRQPTSTATGTREYNRHLQRAYDLTSEEFDLMAKSLNDKLTSLTDTDFVEKYLMRYKDFTGELERSVSDVSQQMETEAVQLRNEIDSNIDNELNSATNTISDEISRLFDEFGL